MIERIRVLSPIRFTSVRRNEVDGVFPSRLPSDGLPTIDVSDSKRRLQRHSLILSDVDYLIDARIALTERGAHQTLAKYVAIFQRRLQNGQHYRPPVLGCREFPADVTDVDGTETPIAENRDLGRMPVSVWRGTKVDPVFASLRMVQGVVAVPLAGRP